MPVFPAVASTIVPPETNFPSCSARLMIPIAARSFTLPPGFRYSSLAKTSADPGGTNRFNCNIGVSPTNCVMSSATRRRDNSEFCKVTLQGTDAASNSSMHARRDGRPMVIHCGNFEGGGHYKQKCDAPGFRQKA